MHKHVSCHLPFPCSPLSPLLCSCLGCEGSVGILAPCALRSTESWLRSISPLYPLWLPPSSALNTLPPSQPLQPLSAASRPTAPASESLHKPHQPTAPTISFLNPASPIIQPAPHTLPLRTFSSWFVAVGPASVTQMHSVALGVRHGNKALVGPVCHRVCGICVFAELQENLQRKRE